MEEKHQRIKEIVEKELSCSAHNMEHGMRVYNLSLHLAKEEAGIDLDVLKTAALLHDIARVKEDKDNSGNIDHAILGAEVAEKIYSDTPIDEYIKDNLVDGKPKGRIKEISKHAPNLEFETKFKHIPDKLYTPKAKELAKKRIEFMKQFFERLKREINGEI